MSLLGSLGISLGAGLLNNLLNRGSRSAERASGELAAEQTEAVRRNNALKDYLVNLLQGQLEGGPPQIDPSMIFQFPAGAGGPSHDPAALAAMMGAVNQGRNLDRLLGLVEGAQNPASALSVQGSLAGQRAQSNRDIAQSIAFALLNNLGGGGSSNPFDDPSTRGTGERLMRPN